MSGVWGPLFEIMEQAGMVGGANPSEDGPGIVAECPQDRRKGVGCPDGSGEGGSNEPGASFGGEVSLAEKAAEWMTSHPEAMGLFERLALQASMSGRRFGMKALAERVRWEYHVEKGDESYKINNNFVSYIARELIRRHPELEAFIELRQTREVAA